MGQFEVLPLPASASSGAPAALPRADVTITMMDYGYLGPRFARGARRCGSRTRAAGARVGDGPPQAGRTAADAQRRWAERGQDGDAPERWSAASRRCRRGTRGSSRWPSPPASTR
jgi:hypothetical protein